VGATIEANLINSPSFNTGISVDTGDALLLVVVFGEGVGVLTGFFGFGFGVGFLDAAIALDGIKANKPTATCKKLLRFIVTPLE
jgi:hypothetical protein